MLFLLERLHRGGGHVTLVPATAAGGGQRGSGKWGGGVVRGAGWLGRWDGGALAAAASPGRLLHPTPVLIPTSSSTHASKPLVQYLIFKITDDKKWIEIEEKGETGASPPAPPLAPLHPLNPLHPTRTLTQNTPTRTRRPAPSP